MAEDKNEFNTNSMAADKTERNYDDAIIGWGAEIAWGAIKKAAMQDDFESQKWFKVSLSITISTSTNNTSFI